MRTRPCALARDRLLNTSLILGSMVGDSLTSQSPSAIEACMVTFSLSSLSPYAIEACMITSSLTSLSQTIEGRVKRCKWYLSEEVIVNSF
jgi:hypothetical protein